MRIATIIEDLDQELLAIDAGHAEPEGREDLELLLREAIALAQWNAQHGIGAGRS
jgi:hypothetical protein